VLLVLAVASPGRAEPAPDPEPDAVLATLPFASDEANRVFVDLARPGDRPFPMMLDTGAGGSVMTPRMARALGVTVRRMKSTPYRKPTVLGRDLQFRVDTRTSDTGSKTGFEYGLLGGDFLEEYVVEIDFPGRQVRLLDPKRFRVPEEVTDPAESAVSLRVTARRPFVEIELDGAPVQVLLDTGAPLPVLIAGKSARKLGIDVDALEPFGEMGFVVGSTEGRLYESGAVRIGSISQGPVPVVVVPRGSFNLGGATDSLAGYDLLAPFLVRLDYPRKRLWLRRTSSLDPVLMGMDYQLGRELGAFLASAGEKMRVWRIRTNGPAQRFGLRVGDHIPGLGPVLSLETIASRVHAGEPLTVLRERDGSWSWVMLPEAAR